MNYILGLFGLLIIIFLIHNYQKKKKAKKLKKWLVANWGKEKTTRYFNFYVIGKYFTNNQHKKEAYHIISDKNSIDLDIDAVFKFIDRTTSKIGQQYLYYKLRTIEHLDKLLDFSQLTQLFEKDKSLSLYCQFELAKLSHNDVYYFEELINGKQVEKPKELYVVKGLTIAIISLIIGAFFYFPIVIFLIPLFAANMFFHYKNKGNINYYLDAVKQLSKSLKVGKKLASHTKIKNYFGDVSFLKKIQSIQLKIDFIGFEKMVNDEFLFIFWFLIEIFKIIFNIEYLVFYSFIDSIVKEKNSIEKLYVFIGKIDVAISTASLKSSEKKVCTPQFTEEKTMIASEVYHPFIKNCVPNNLELINNSMLLTGSNMSGKTTFIRTIAINSILAQTLHFCYAKNYTAPYFKIYSSIRITDNLLESTSYYLEEVLTVKKLIEASENSAPCLFVLDEIFKGTNTIERVSGGKAILKYLNKKNHIVLVSTHDIELTELLAKKQYNLFHFSEQIENEALIFDHKLKKGKLTTRNAIKILGLYGYPNEVIANALKTQKKI